MMDAAAAQGTPIEEGDILVVTQKVISKVEGKVVSFDDIEPSQLAITITEGHRRDPRHTEAILREAVRIVRMDRGVIIAETKHGFYCANAGIDASNIPGDNTIALLPDDSDVSAQGIRAAVQARLGVDVAVIVSDTFGRPWRNGAANIAIGVAGMDPLLVLRGSTGCLRQCAAHHPDCSGRRAGRHRRAGHGKGPRHTGDNHPRLPIRAAWKRRPYSGCCGPESATCSARPVQGDAS